MLYIDRALIAAAEQCGTTIQAIQSGKRTRSTSTARWLLWHVLVNDAGMSLPDAAKHGGAHDHTSVLYALKQPIDPVAREAVRRALLGQQTTIEDCRIWIERWRIIRATLRWRTADDLDMQEALDAAGPALEVLRRALERVL